jgi:hypothetical protein
MNFRLVTFIINTIDAHCVISPALHGKLSETKNVETNYEKLLLLFCRVGNVTKEFVGVEEWHKKVDSTSKLYRDKNYYV